MPSNEAPARTRFALLLSEAIAEAVQRPTMHFVAIKTPEQMDLLALHRVRSRLVSQRTGVINQIRGSLIERGISAPVLELRMSGSAVAKNGQSHRRAGPGLASIGRAHCS